MFRTASFSPILLCLVVSGGMSATPRPDPPAVMFRGNPAHTGVSGERFFSGQGGVKWRVETGAAVRSSPAVTATRVFVGSNTDRTGRAPDTCSSGASVPPSSGYPQFGRPPSTAFFGGRLYKLGNPRHI
jgi:hypothetical protein